MQSFEALNLTNLEQPVWIYDVIDFQIFWANDAALRLWEADSVTELQQRDFKTNTSEAVQQKLLGFLKDCEANRTIECWWRLSPKEINKQVFLKFSGIKIKEARTALLVTGLHSELLSRSLGEIGKSLLLALFHIDGSLISFNPPFKDQFSLQSCCFEDLIKPPTSLQQLLPSDEVHYENDHLLFTRDGERWHHLELDREPNSERIIATLTDIHDRKLNELKHEYDSITDSLTGLLNRRGILEKLRSINHLEHTVFYIDLDGFKPVNDSYGHAVGDAVLKKVALLLEQNISSNVVCARLGGDEFIVVSIGALSVEEMSSVAKSLVQQLSTPIQIDRSHRTLISASIGVVSNLPIVRSPERLITCADAAMYEAKHNGRNRFVIYSSGMEDRLLRRSTIIQGLESAIEQNQLKLYYQILFKKHSHETVGAEALLRWEHPTLGNIPPLDIISAAEETGRISVLENWIFRRACLDLPKLKQLYGDSFTIGINISGAHLSQINFIDDIKAVLNETQCKPQDIVIELTESILVSTIERQQHVLQTMCDLGFTFAIDDFGTGYSSLAYLGQIPAKFVKVDKAFIDNIDKDPYTLKFIRDLCESLNMYCLVEGVETSKQAAHLDQIGINYRQGFFYNYPVPLEELKTKMNQSANHLSFSD
ncbi:putative bifunctional diguanylate cyclase/phosphodiesterase [Marinomonas ostreistagni]|uniref:EAL domain-containing protein n=1 Tax=Marinomonas ostreistagni TaxID=359209 RepID=A0ABS0ZBN4_9GAMM|nr:EAL domain-containing protein [Marinomonas ostreistagni]MBJ7550818.1 EAL domain-containing protein [Marinomonas ostreistagni]